ncbi:VanW family protein [Desulforamulus reducens MI-1]|uniref:VanW family protein n=2 Tax=Desulforamulus TaxID=2916693 RepID=A4J3Q9_DESRM|nr:VanW family protein [Desulforamulus reducens MI-1]
MAGRIVLLGIVAFFIGVAVAFFEMESAEARKIPAGTYVQGVELSNLEKKQAEQRLVQIAESIMNRQATLTYQDKSWTFSLQQLGVVVNVEDTLYKALQGKEHSFIKEITTYFYPEKKEITLTMAVNKEKLKTVLAPIFQTIERPATDAVLTVLDNEEILVKPDQKGIKVDVKKLCEDLLKASVNQENPRVQFKIIETFAAKTLADIQGLNINGKISSFTTNFNGKNVNRTINIRTAARKIDGLILAPGEEFSFNRRVGERTSNAGYRPAAVIVGNKFDDALGGGICQVSTTLYNAILLANLTPSERHNHSLAISYVPLGRDAAVAWDFLDFKFKNTLPGHLYLRTIVGRDYITVQVYGDVNQKRDILIRSWVTEIIEPDVKKETDPKLQPGQEILIQAGSPGFKAQSERVIREKGVVIKREALPTSYYHARAKQVKVGPEQTNKPMGENSVEQQEPEIEKNLAQTES